MMPVMLDVKDKICTVIGGGNAAYRKAKTLLLNGARVKVVSPELDEKFASLNIEYIEKEYSVGDIKNSFVVIAATDDKELNYKIGNDVRSLGTALFMAADNKDNSDMMFMAYAECGDIKIAASTNGEFPMLGAKICSELFGECERYNKITGILSCYRQKIRKSEIDSEKKHELMKALVSDNILHIKDMEELEQEAERIISKWI